MLSFKSLCLNYEHEGKWIWKYDRKGMYSMKLGYRILTEQLKQQSPNNGFHLGKNCGASISHLNFVISFGDAAMIVFLL